MSEQEALEFDLDTGDVNVVPVGVGLPELPIERVLDAGFPLAALLTFVPDVALKRELERACAAAQAVDVKAEGGLERLDAALAEVRQAMKPITVGFEIPADLANRLHKRITGLRGDFLSVGEQTLRVRGKDLIDERRRRQAIADEARRKAQEEADRKARADAKRLAQEAQQSGAPKAVVTALKTQAKTAVAAPVASPVAEPKLSNSTTVANWKARVRGTLPGQEPNPKTSEMNEAQLDQVRALLRDIVDGKEPVTMVEVNWPAVNARAKAEKGTMRIAGLEAFDAGSLRSKGRP